MSKIKMGIGKGLFMPEVTVEMFRNASLEAVAEWLESGEVFDIDLKEEIHREREQAYMQGYEDGRKRLIKLIQNSIEDGEDCSRTMTKQEAVGFLERMRDCSSLELYDLEKDAINIACKVLEQEPTRGKWIEIDEYSECSCCGAESCGETPFCPNCGARMESDGEDTLKKCKGEQNNDENRSN